MKSRKIRNITFVKLSAVKAIIAILAAGELASGETANNNGTSPASQAFDSGVAGSSSAQASATFSTPMQALSSSYFSANPGITVDDKNRFNSFISTLANYEFLSGTGPQLVDGVLFSTNYQKAPYLKLATALNTIRGGTSKTGNNFILNTSWGPDGVSISSGNFSYGFLPLSKDCRNSTVILVYAPSGGICNIGSPEFPMRTSGTNRHPNAGMISIQNGQGPCGTTASQQWLWVNGNSAVGYGQIQMRTGTATNNTTIKIAPGGVPETHYGPGSLDTNFFTLACTANNGELSFYVDGQLAATGKGGVPSVESNALQYGSIASGTAPGDTGTYQAVLVFDPLTQAQIKQVEEALRWLDSRDTNVVIVGDSTSCWNSDPARLDWPTQLRNSGVYPWNRARFINLAVGGLGAGAYAGADHADMYTHPITRAPGGPVKRSILLCHLGINDFVAYTDPDYTLTHPPTAADATYSKLKDIWSRAKWTGMEVYAMTLPDGDYLGAMKHFVSDPRPHKDMLNAKIIADPTQYDVLIRNDLVFPSFRDSSSFFNHLHLSAAGNAKWADNIALGGTPPYYGGCNPNAKQTTVAGSTSGTATFCQPFSGISYKRVTIKCLALTGIVSYEFPCPFSAAPQVISQSLSNCVTKVSDSSVTLTGTNSTGFIELSGF